MIDPEHGAELWGRLRFGTVVSPGVCKLSGPGLVVGWDIQDSTASAGATTKRKNEPLKKFSAEFDLSNETDEFGFSDFDRWDDFQAFLESLIPPNKKPVAAAVYHPDLARVHITAVTLESIGLVVLDGRGGGKVTVSFIEHRPPKPLKPVASTKTEGDKKIDAANAEIKALQEEWKSLDGSKPAGPPLGSTLP